MKVKPYLTGKIYRQKTVNKIGYGMKMKLISFEKCPYRKKDCTGNNCPGKLVFKEKRSAICGYLSDMTPKYIMFKNW